MMKPKSLWKVRLWQQEEKDTGDGIHTKQSLDNLYVSASSPEEAILAAAKKNDFNKYVEVNIRAVAQEVVEG